MPGAAFCASCGQPVAPADSSAGIAVASGLRPNVAGALCYLVGFITGILFLVLEPYQHDRFVRFHAFQSIFLSLAGIVMHFAVGILLLMLPWTLWHLVQTLSSLISLALLAVALWLMYKAYKNQRFRLPMIGDLADRQA
jgi:uncharacterized membrane protein